MQAFQGPSARRHPGAASATVLSLMIVGSFMTPIFLTAGTVAFAFFAVMSQ